MNFSDINFDRLNGLIPAVIQDASTREVLMVGFMNKEALQKTLEDGKVTFWSRTKQRLWQKGETSGNFLQVCDVRLDCDQDTVLILAKPVGPTCHAGQRTCFGEGSLGVGILADLSNLIETRKKELPLGSYTTSLFQEGLPKICAKVEEESGEVIQAALQESDERLAEEISDLLYHLLVLISQKGLSLAEILLTLENRRENS